MGSPRNASASVLIFRRTIALSSWGVYDLFSIVTLWSVPILRLICITVRSGFRTAWRFAGSPTRICPSFVNAITDGNILPPYVEPSALGMIFGVPPSMYAASEFVVPRSIPMILGIVLTFLLHDDDLGGPQDLSLEVVPLPDDLLHDAVRRPRVVHLLDALVEVRVEGGTRGGDLLEPGLPESPEEVVPEHREPLARPAPDGRARRVEVVEERQEAGNETLVRVPDDGLHVPLRALAEVLEVRLQVLEAGVQLVASPPGFPELPRQLGHIHHPPRPPHPGFREPPRELGHIHDLGPRRSLRRLRFRLGFFGHRSPPRAPTGGSLELLALAAAFLAAPRAAGSLATL